MDTHHFPLLHIRDYTLRQIIPADISNIFAGLSHPDVIKYYGVRYNTLSETRQQMDWYNNLELQGTGIWWAIEETESKIFCGAVGINNLDKNFKCAEIGYWLLPEFWKKSIMKKAVPEIIRYSFNVLQLHRLTAYVETGNTASETLLLRTGFNYEGTMQDCEIKEGNFISLKIYAILNTP